MVGMQRLEAVLDGKQLIIKEAGHAYPYQESMLKVWILL